MSAKPQQTTPVKPNAVVFMGCSCGCGVFRQPEHGLQNAREKIAPWHHLYARNERARISHPAEQIARADVGAAEAELRLNEAYLAKVCICSHINGVVLKRNVDPGQTAASSLQAPVLFTIAEDLKLMELRVYVDEAKVRVGQNASFSLDAFPDRKFPGTIRDLRFASETIRGVVTSWHSLRRGDQVQAPPVVGDKRAKRRLRCQA